MIDFRNGRDGRLPAPARDALFDGDTWRQALDQIDIRFFKLLDELARVGRHAVEKSALPLRKKNVEGQSGFTRTAQAGNDDHLVARTLDRNVFEIVLARAVNRDGVVGSDGSSRRGDPACSAGQPAG